MRFNSKAKDIQKLSEKTIKDISAARARIKKGNFVSEKDAITRLKL